MAPRYAKSRFRARGDALAKMVPWNDLISLPQFRRERLFAKARLLTSIPRLYLLPPEIKFIDIPWEMAIHLFGNPGVRYREDADFS